MTALWNLDRIDQQQLPLNGTFSYGSPTTPGTGEPCASLHAFGMATPTLVIIGGMKLTSVCRPLSTAPAGIAFLCDACATPPRAYSARKADANTCCVVLCRQGGDHLHARLRHPHVTPGGSQLPPQSSSRWPQQLLHNSYARYLILLPAALSFEASLGGSRPQQVANPVVGRSPQPMAPRGPDPATQTQEFQPWDGTGGSRASVGPDFVDRDGAADDCDGHGTHVASTGRHPVRDSSNIAARSRQHSPNVVKSLPTPAACSTMRPNEAACMAYTYSSTATSCRSSGMQHCSHAVVTARALHSAMASADMCTVASSVPAAAGRSVGVAKEARVVAVRVLDCEGAGSISSVVAGESTHHAVHSLSWQVVVADSNTTRAHACQHKAQPQTACALLCIGSGWQQDRTASALQAGKQPWLSQACHSCTPVAHATVFGHACAGLDWVAQTAVKPAVVSLSLGVPAGQWSQPMEDAIKHLTEVVGLPVVVASGNSAKDSCGVAPARVASAITVAASNIPNKFGQTHAGEPLSLVAPAGAGSVYVRGLPGVLLMQAAPGQLGAPLQLHGQSQPLAQC